MRPPPSDPGPTEQAMQAMHPPQLRCIVLEIEVDYLRIRVAELESQLETARALYRDMTAEARRLADLLRGRSP